MGGGAMEGRLRGESGSRSLPEESLLRLRHQCCGKFSCNGASCLHLVRSRQGWLVSRAPLVDGLRRLNGDSSCRGLRGLVYRPPEVDSRNRTRVGSSRASDPRNRKTCPAQHVQQGLEPRNRRPVAHIDHFTALRNPYFLHIRYSAERQSESEVQRHAKKRTTSAPHSSRRLAAPHNRALHLPARATPP